MRKSEQTEWLINTISLAINHPLHSRRRCCSISPASLAILSPELEPTAGLWQCSHMHIVAKTGGLVCTYQRPYPCLRLFMSLSRVSYLCSSASRLHMPSCWQMISSCENLHPEALHSYYSYIARQVRRRNQRRFVFILDDIFLLINAW
jgi:hypothetical protein